MRQLLVGCGVLATAACCRGQTLVAVSHWLIYDDVEHRITFEIEFNRKPDLATVSGSGAQRDSFQLMLDTMPGNNGYGGTSPLPWETIVRGEEIHEYARIPVRDHIHGPSSQPGSGGWGPIVTLLDYELTGTHLNFCASYDHLSTANGRFSYELELYENGSWTGATYAGTTVPAPTSALVVLAAAGLCRRRR